MRAASRQVGASPDAGYRWVKQAGLSVRRATPRAYTTAEKEEFFRRLEATPNVSAVARSLGFNRVPCYKWAHQAGIFTGTNLDAHRTEFLRLRAAGWSREHARAATGLDKRSAADADKGIRTFYGGRILADGTVIRYTNQQILDRVKNARVRYVQGERVNLDAVEKVIHARYLSIVERETVFDLRREASASERSPHGWDAPHPRSAANFAATPLAHTDTDPMPRNVKRQPGVLALVR